MAGCYSWAALSLIDSKTLYSSRVRVRVEAEHHREREHGRGADRSRLHGALDSEGFGRLEAPHADSLRSGRSHLHHALASMQQ